MNQLGIKGQQIKVNRKVINNYRYFNQAPLNSINSQYYERNTNKLIPQGIKNMRYQTYLDQNPYTNNNIVTEYDNIQQYPNNPSNAFNLINLSPNNIREIYKNTNENIIQEKNLNIKDKNNNISEKKMFKNLTNREVGKMHKISSYNKGNKKSNIIQINLNSREKILNKILNQRNLIKKERKLHVTRSEIQYPLNFYNHNYKNKYQSYNNTKNSTNNNTNNNTNNSYNNNIIENNNDEMIINLATQKIPNNHEKNKKYNKESPIPVNNSNHSNNNKRIIKQNKGNLQYINRRKNNTVIKPELFDINFRPCMKRINIYSNSSNNIINTYNSCQNFYQKNNNINRNENNLNMLNTINNFEYVNNANSTKGNNNKINILYENNHKEKNDLNHINIVEKDDFGNNLNINNINKNFIYNNKINTDNIMKNKEHKKGKLNINNLNLNNNKEILNKILNQKNNKLINYKKRLLEQFCHSLEEFIFINVKNNFDLFIRNLKEYSKQKHFSSLLLKRLQNKNIQKNFYKEGISSCKELDQNFNSHYSSIIMMNNSNIINVQRKGDYFPNDLSKEFYERKSLYDFRNINSPPLSEKICRMKNRLRSGKSHEPFDANNYVNYNFYNNNTYLRNNKFETYNSNDGRKNIYNDINNIYINVEDEKDKKNKRKYETYSNDNKLYIPKKFKRNNTNMGFSNKSVEKNNNNFDILNRYVNIPKEKKIYSKIFNPDNRNDISHEINNNINLKINRNYNIDCLKKNNTNNNSSSNYQDLSCDTNLNYNINQDFDFLDKTNDIMKRNYNNQLSYGNTYNSFNSKKKENMPVYKKKIRITQNKSKIFMHKASPNNIRNKFIKLNTTNKTCGHLMSPNLEKNNINKQNLDINNNFEKIISLNSFNFAHLQNFKNIRCSFTEPRRESDTNIRQHNKAGKIQELTVNLSKNDNKIKYNYNNNTYNSFIHNDYIANDSFNTKNNLKEENNTYNYESIDDNNKRTLNEEKPFNETKKDNYIVNENKNDTQDENIKENDMKTNIELNNDKNQNINQYNENENNTETITNNNENIDYNAMSNDNNIINDDTDESDDNFTKEIIVKDVSTNDKRLNVYIKYIELQNFNTSNTEFNDIHLFNSIQTDSIFLPSLYSQKTNFYYNNYYGNKFDNNNKYKLHKILTSIIEEEEKSKAAWSINNSYLSEEEISRNGNKYSHFFIQSIKYVSSFLQSIFDDKKRDIYFQFFKILKKIKNEAFLKGLISQKNFHNLNNFKNEPKGNENKNSISKDVILNNTNNEYNINTNYYGSKRNYKNDINPNNNNNNENKIKDENNNKYNNFNSEQKFFTANSIPILTEDNINLDKSELKRNNSTYSYDYNNDINENEKEKQDNKKLINNIIGSFIEVNKKGMKNKNYIKNKKLDDNNKLKQIIEKFEEIKNIKKIQKFFKFWKKGIKEDKDIYSKNEEDAKYNDKKEEHGKFTDYDKKETINEACRGLSEVIYDFKIHLLRFCLKKRVNDFE